MSVDLPVPFPPTRPTRSLGVISQSAFSKRSLWPKRFPAPDNWIMGLDLSSHKTRPPEYLVPSTENFVQHKTRNNSGLSGAAALAFFGGFGPEGFMKIDALKGAVDHRLEFMRVPHLTPFRQALLRFLSAEPGGIAQHFVRTARSMHFHQKGFDHELLNAAGLPEHALGVKVQMKVARLDGAQGAGFLRRFTFRSLAMRHVGTRRDLGKGPLVAAIGVDQQEFHSRAPSAIANRGHLQRQGFRSAW